MSKEFFKPHPIRYKNSFSFKIRLVFDQQLFTIYRFLKKNLTSLKHGNLLDIGCGYMPYKHLLNKNIKYYGLDIRESKKFGFDGTNHSQDPFYFTYDGKKFPFSNNSFDSALCVEVLEHAEEPLLLIKEMSRILKKNSFLFLTAPWSARVHHEPFDFYRFTPYTLKKFFTSNNFTVISISPRGNEFSVIYNKLLVLFIVYFERLVTPLFFIYFLLIPLIALLLTIFFILMQLSSLFGYKSSQSDPLGFNCIFKKN